jgi:hypothetical protein
MRADHSREAGAGEAMTRYQELVEWAQADPVNAEILRRLPALGLEQAYLVAGCVYQAVWNRQAGLLPGSRIKDYDIFYFDGSDLSYEAEDAVIRRAAALFADLEAEIELKNQARVHLWYPERFGAAYPQLTSTRDGIDRYLVACTCVGIEAETLEVYAPYGLEELWAGILRPNPVNLQIERFREKAASYQARWPWLQITGA